MQCTKKGARKLAKTKMNVANFSFLFQVSEIENVSPLSFSSITMMILIGIFTLLVVYELWFRNLRYVKLGNQIPGPKTLPVFGNAFLALGHSPGGKIF